MGGQIRVQRHAQFALMDRPFGHEFVSEARHSRNKLRTAVECAGNQIRAIVLHSDKRASRGEGRPVHKNVRRWKLEPAEDFVERLFEVVKGTRGYENVGAAGFLKIIGETDARFIALRGEFFCEGPLVGQVVYGPGYVRREANLMLIGVEKIAHVTAQIEDSADDGS